MRHEALGTRQGAGGRRQEAGGKWQEAGVRRQEAGGKRQEARDRSYVTPCRKKEEGGGGTDFKFGCPPPHPSATGGACGGLQLLPSHRRSGAGGESTGIIYPIQKNTEICYKNTEMYKKNTELEISCWNVLDLLRSEVAYIGSEPTLKTFPHFFNYRSFEGVEAQEGCENVA
jgi:hypothetical protein